MLQRSNRSWSLLTVFKPIACRTAFSTVTWKSFWSQLSCRGFPRAEFWSTTGNTEFYPSSGADCVCKCTGIAHLPIGELSKKSQTVEWSARTWSTVWRLICHHVLCQCNCWQVHCKEQNVNKISNCFKQGRGDTICPNCCCKATSPDMHELPHACDPNMCRHWNEKQDPIAAWCPKVFHRDVSTSCPTLGGRRLSHSKWVC